MKLRMLSDGRRVAFALGAVTVLGFLLRVWEIGAKGLWLDEAFSVWLGWQPLRELLAWVVKIDQHPPLYYTLLHFWMKIAGDSPNDIRMLSAILGTLTIPVMFLLGRRLMGTTVGLLAALILALSPFHVRFAQETRMYTTLHAECIAGVACPVLSPHRCPLGHHADRATSRRFLPRVAFRLPRAADERHRDRSGLDRLSVFHSGNPVEPQHGRPVSACNELCLSLASSCGSE